MHWSWATLVEFEVEKMMVESVVLVEVVERCGGGLEVDGGARVRRAGARARR